MKLLLLNGCIFHHELFAYMLEFADYIHATIDILTNTEAEMGWLSYLQKKYTNCNYVQTYDPNNYDIIILLTDDDPFFSSKEFIEPIKHKLLCIDHYYQIRNPYPIHRVCTRPFYNDPRPYAYHTYSAISPEEKQKALSKTEIHIACIGDRHYPTSAKLKSLFPNSNNIHFHIINRQLYEKCPDPNYHYYIQCSAEELFNIVKQCHYTFTYYEEPYLTKQIPCFLPYSYSCGCQLILPASYKVHYQLTSPIYYEKEITLPIFPAIEKVFTERTSIIQHRNDVLSKMVNKIIG